MFVALVLGSSILAAAKEAPPDAVVLFDGKQGAAYVQIAKVTLNGKTEIRICFPEQVLPELHPFSVEQTGCSC